ncbi:MAG: VCBS repeat-containing protein, partial [Thermoanaerobaculia bacterium]|nr:VCBS repeat-containing protein [Thermoanaerobaculia bacterium]
MKHRLRSWRKRAGTFEERPREAHRNPRLRGVGVPAATALGLLLAVPVSAAGEEPAGIFTDVTTASGIDFVHTFGDEEMSNLVESSGYGVCLFDADGDGRLDVYFANGSRHPEVSEHPEGTEAPGELPTNRLYRNVTEPGGALRFEDVTVGSGTGDTGFSMGCVAGDLDGDGDRDLVVTNYGPNRAYRNDGPGPDGVPRFTDVTEESGLGDPAWGMGAALLDFDGDGRLDLYVGNYVRFDPDYRAFYVTDRFPGPLAYPGSPDRLYRNLGGWRFQEISREAGVANPEGRAMGVGVSDLGGDGRPDVFVSNDAMANSLFRNRGDGSFEDVALFSGLAYSENGEATAAMGVDFGDLDGDGALEIFVPDMSFSTLYAPEEGDTFHDRSRQWGLAPVAAQYVGWSGHLIDYDLDGWLDLFMTTGDLHDIEPTEDILLHNEGSGGSPGSSDAPRLRDAAEEGGAHFHEGTMGRGAAVGDLDDDGDPDIVLNVLAGPAVVLRNDQITGNHWLGVRLSGPEGNPDGIGARIEVVTSGGGAP